MKRLSDELLPRHIAYPRGLAAYVLGKDLATHQKVADSRCHCFTHDVLQERACASPGSNTALTQVLTYRSMLLRNGEILEVDTLSELGIYGTFVRQGDRVILNEEAGHLIRTKAATSDEGGVAAGFAVLDSPYLTE